MSKSKAPGPQDNVVSRATQKALKRVDFFLGGGVLDPPTSKYLAACDELLQTRSASVFTGIFFFMFYWLEEPAWDLNSIPVGWRNQSYGDKFLCEALTNRNIHLHGRIKAYGENIGSKGNQASFRPLADSRYSVFLKAVAHAPVTQRTRIADYLAQRFAESRQVPTALPPVRADVLTFVRAKDLFHKLLGTPSGGAIQQLLVAALLFVYRRKSVISVVTHQVHSSDVSDQFAGDIEEYKDGQLHRAYEVTGRPEWKARISGFKHKMDKFGLTKYVIIVGGLNGDDEWAVPANLALKLDPYGRDIAIIDILDVLNFLAAELTPEELRESINKCYDYLNDLTICGRPEYIKRYIDVVHGWLTSPGAIPGGPEHGTQVEGQAGEWPIRGTDARQLEADEGDQGEGKQEHRGPAPLDLGKGAPPGVEGPSKGDRR